MNRAVRRTPAAKRDIIEIALTIAAERPSAADRFLDAVEDAFELLGRMPDAGTVRPVASKRLAGLRFWPIAGFRNYLIFYQKARGGIKVVRVLHGARNLNRIFRPPR